MPNLVGIGNSQAPTNAMLGGLAYQDSVGEINIDKIKARITGTAVDVFVYDTRKDSDGGAWRHRTQNTSWYNEGVSKSRGARKEFPTVAVIVIAYENLTIYDGDDPNLPMWMDFDYGASGLASITMLYANGKAVSALNGVICSVGSAGWHDGLTAIDFIADNAKWRNSSYIANWTNGIGNRNVAGGYGSFITAPDEIIVSAQVNDVAMTVLPNAPINDSTGLPVPTIALATDGGVSVINNDGGVFDTVATTNGYISSRKVEFSDSGEYLYIIQDPGLIYSYKTSVFSVNRSGGTLTGYAGLSFFSGYVTDSGSASDTKLTKGSDVTINIGHANTGLALLYPDYSYTSNSLDNSSGKMICRVTKDFNTGWMHGDIKGAFMSDTDTTDATYSTVADDWATAGAWTKQGSITISSTGSGTSGTLSITGNGTGSNVYFFNPITVEANTDYVVSITFGAENANTFVINTTQYNAGTGVLLDINALSGLTRGGHFNSGSNTTLYIQGWQTSTSATTITNLVIQKVSEKDRSVNNKGLLVFGTITKSTVATGADLVSYGPFSTTNRLRQPYNSDLNVETNDFSIMFWMNNNGTNSHQTLVSRDNREFDVSILDNDTYSRRFRIYADQSNDSSNNFDSNDDPFPLNVWSHVCVNYTGGNTVSIYVNGVLNKSGTLNYDIDDTSHGLNIGARNTSGSYAHAADGTKLALVRISKGAPSPEQIKKIYSDEKCLFHEEAKCTLSGTSDAITGLGFDDTTDVLHAGTSSGRSEFQGLNRINNTTTAVTTTISASNEFIAEQ